MAICPKCGMSFSYEAPHVCDGGDATNLCGLFAAPMVPLFVIAGAVAGAAATVAGLTAVLGRLPPR